MNGIPAADKIVFDTNILLGFLKQHEGYPDLRVLFSGSDLFISEITEFELLSFWNITPAEEAAVKGLLQDLVIVPFLPEIKRQAVIFRRTARTRTPDAIIAATAIVLDAALVSNDEKLRKTAFPGLRVHAGG
jgi:predicted nucleic acid-binding protein